MIKSHYELFRVLWYFDYFPNNRTTLLGFARILKYCKVLYILWHFKVI